MSRGKTLSTIAAVVTVLVLGLAISPAAQAQRGGGGGRGGFGGGGRGGFGGGPGGMGMGLFGPGPMGQRDPMRSAEPILLQRDDVQHELLLDGRQQEQVTDAVKQTQQDTMTKSRAAMQTVRQNMQTNGQNLRNMTPEERQAATQQMQKDLQTALDPIMEEQNKTLEALLTKSQVARLRQLDLQWRTALSLNDPKIAAKFDLTPDQTQQISAIYQEYLTAQRQAMSGFGPRRNNRGGRGANNANANTQGQDPNQANGQDPNAPQTPPDPEAIQQRMLQAIKDVDAARKAGSDKVLAVLTPDQKGVWTKMTGRVFVFKQDAPPTPPTPQAAPGN